MEPLCPECGCREDGYHPGRREQMQPWAKCCPYGERKSAPGLTDYTLQILEGVEPMTAQEIEDCAVRIDMAESVTLPRDEFRRLLATCKPKVTHE